MQKTYYVAGYSDNNPATGVLDAPQATALLLDDNSGRGALLLVSLDAVGLGAVGLMKSPVRGGDGNTEFLVYAKRGVPRTVGERETAEAVQA